MKCKIKLYKMITKCFPFSDMISKIEPRKSDIIDSNTKLQSFGHDSNEKSWFKK